MSALTKGHKMRCMTDGMREIAYDMSNFDSVVDTGFAEALQAEPGAVFGRHSAWDFNGKVWYADEQFHEEVWRYRVPQEVMSANTLETLMKMVCDKWGWK